MSFKSLVNRSPEAIAIVVDGKQIVLNGHAANIFPEHIATLFLQKYGTDYLEELNVNDVVPEELKQETKDVWFANISGNPDAPDSYEEDMKLKDGEEKKLVLVKNPFKAPRAWREEMKPSMFFDDPNDPDKFTWRAEAGSDAVFIPIEIPAYKIVKFKPHIAEFIRRRNMNSSIMSQNLQHLIESREPPSFRPDMSWALDDIRYWLVLAKPNYDTDKTERQKLGRTENEIRARMKGEDTDVERDIFEAKNNLLTRCFFCIADPGVPLPSRDEFEAFKQRKDAQKRARQLAKETETTDVIPQT